MKKLVSILLATVLAATLLAGCGHTHVWQEATCTAPKTCTECQEIEGEALPHTWAEATCAAPKTCTVCGATEGEALPHTWAEVSCAAPKTCTVCGATEGVALAHTLTPANYQSPAICTVCGGSEGEPIPAAFAEKGYALMSEGKEYDYPTVCKDNHSIKHTGIVSIDNYRVVASDDTHEARDEYEWRIANINFTFTDPSAWQKGYMFSVKTMDYYLGLYGEEPINYNGVNYERKVKYNEFPSKRTPEASQVTLEVAIQVPVGYDGMILCLYNPVYSEPVSGSKMTTLDEYAAAEPMFFRMA